MVEAMAKKKPVIAFDIKSSAEVVDDGTCGYLVPRGDVEAMADRVLRLAGNRKLREEFGRRGLQKVENQFTINNTIEEVRDFLTVKNGVTGL